MNLAFLLIVEDESDKKFILDLYLQFYPLLKQRAYSFTHNNDVVDDLIHDSFIKIIPKISFLRSLSSYKLASYIVNTLKHTCLDYIRKEKRRNQRVFTGMTDDMAEQIPNLLAAVTEDKYIQQEASEALEQVLLQLPERDRNLLYFKYNMSMKDKEIGRLLDIAEQHVRQYVARARRKALQIMSEGEGYNVRDE
ncbi:RNA polymerase sigma factor [Paenibacillus sp. p3-SID867]|uniref:RNA polymerase sigma factor n=1 Tax=Paenibacillus sp. p3-SID867 TaxID=2916363 RepID=UPI0021A81024|nr:RNA polymerase sigma factor [Paenibacillus sp. p3-SID867]MCT1402839.1 RNA polymerase sigma factor [Paenibacillus sp. p3-SID867]